MLFFRKTTPSIATELPDFSGGEPCEDDDDDVDCSDDSDDTGGGGSGWEESKAEQPSSSSDFNFRQTTRDEKRTPELIPFPKPTTPQKPPTRPEPPVSSEDNSDDSTSMTSNVDGATSAASFRLNLTLLVGISLGLLILIFILVYAVYKYRKRDEGVYKIDNKNARYESVNTKAPSSDSNGVASSKHATNGSKSSRKKGPVKEWYV